MVFLRSLSKSLVNLVSESMVDMSARVFLSADESSKALTRSSADRFAECLFAAVRRVAAAAIADALSLSDDAPDTDLDTF